ALICALQLYPLPLVEIPNHGCFLDKHVVDAEMINGWRLGSSISLIVAHDVVFADGLYASRIAPLIVTEQLYVTNIFSRRDGGGILLGAVPKHKDRGHTFD